MHHANVEGIFSKRKNGRNSQRRPATFNVKEALTELASDFKAMAKDLEQRNER